MVAGARVVSVSSLGLAQAFRSHRALETEKQSMGQGMGEYAFLSLRP